MSTAQRPMPTPVRYPLADYIRQLGLTEHLQFRFFQEAFTEASATQWRARAELFEWCRPRPDDFMGKATPEQIAAVDARLAATAQDCRDHAAVIERGLLG